MIWEQNNFSIPLKEKKTFCHKIILPKNPAMKLHYLQHVPFEGLGIIEDWAKTQDAEISCTRLFAGEQLPDIGSFDWLVVMGGPMGIYDHKEHPWLIAEKEFIKAAIDTGKTVLGICLGAQLIADVLGAKVYPGSQKEIGWFPIQRSEGAPELLPATLTAFHWHGDTFELPAGATRLASSEACKNQGFIYNDRVVALQFHLETTPESMEALIENCAEELPNVDAASSFVQKERQTLMAPLPAQKRSKHSAQSNEAGREARLEERKQRPEGEATVVYIQTAKQMRAGLSNLGKVNTAMMGLLDQLNAAPHCLQ